MSVFIKAVRVIANLIAVGIIATSCSEPPASPTAPSPQAHLDRPGIQPTGLLPCSDLPFKSRTRTIGRRGGTITAGPHQLKIPRGALERPTAITMTVTTGRGVNAVHLEPEGLQFDRPASLTMTYVNCDLTGKVTPNRIAFIDDALKILYYVRSFDNIPRRSVTGKLDHFSDYVIAW